MDIAHDLIFLKIQQVLQMGWPSRPRKFQKTPPMKYSQQKWRFKHLSIPEFKPNSVVV